METDVEVVFVQIYIFFFSLFLKSVHNAKTEYFQCVAKLIDYEMTFQLFFNCSSPEDNSIIIQLISLPAFVLI